MKTFKIFTIMGLVLTSLLISCSPNKAATVSEASGVQLWGENCIRCHNTPSPSDFNDTDWSTIELHMKVRANLTDEESKKIFAFIKSAN